MTVLTDPLSSFRPKRSGVEKSPPLMVRAALLWEISRLRVSWERFPSAPYRHAPPLEMTCWRAPLPSFRPKRSGVEKSPSSNGTVSIIGEISRLRVSSKRFPSAPYRHGSPLEMTMLASSSGHTFGVRVQRVHKVQRVQRVVVAALPQILKKAAPRPPSFRPKRSGVEKSPPSDGPGSITAGDLRAQSIIGAVPVCPYTDTQPRPR